MVRIFDSMVYEDEVTDDLTLGISATGELDPSQTRQTMYLDCNTQNTIKGSCLTA